MSKPCPECRSTERKQSPGEYALIGITNGRIQLHTDAPKTTVVAVHVSICEDCGYVTLHESA